MKRLTASIRDRVLGLMSICDEPDDDEETRIRKRAGIAIGLALVFIPLAWVPLAVAQDQPLMWGMSLVSSAIAAANLALVARTRDFTRFIHVNLATGAFVVLVGGLSFGGLAASSTSVVWGLLLPVAGLLFLGPARATPWAILYGVILATAIALDPLASAAIEPPPYAVRLAFYAFNVGTVALIVFLLVRYVDIRRREAQARSDELLTNAIPPSIALRLKRGERRIAETYPDTTVLFADLVGFTAWAERTDASEVVGALDHLFTTFDELAAECGMEKIKTIGDAYMAVAGAPDARSDHAEAALLLGRDMMRSVATWHAATGAPLELRVGLASGPLVAGVIGHRRLLFDLWGDTVNTASRMESSGLPGRIQVAPATWELLCDRYAFERRDAVEVKGKGPMTTYVLVDA